MMELWAGEKREIVTDLEIPHYDFVAVCRRWFRWGPKPRAWHA